MRFSYVILLIVVVAIAGFIYYTTRGGPSPEVYAEMINKERQEKDMYMKSGDDSPFASRPEAFTGLHYFAPDLRYRVTATLAPIEKKKVRVMATSDGKEKKYLEFAQAEFDLSGTRCSLLILEIMESGPYRGTLFLAFADETSGAETYGAGRYLDVKKVPGASSVTLDFNQAYNPYCAYSDGFSCPFPPPENVLKVPVRAGEKNYHE